MGFSAHVSKIHQCFDRGIRDVVLESGKKSLVPRQAKDKIEGVMNPKVSNSEIRCQLPYQNFVRVQCGIQRA